MENVVVTPCNGHGGECKNNAQFDGFCFFCHTAINYRLEPRPGTEAFTLLQRWLDICSAIIADPPSGLSPTEFGYLEADTKDLISRMRPTP